VQTFVIQLLFLGSTTHRTDVSKKNIILFIGCILIGLYIGLAGFVRWGDELPPQITLQQPFLQVGPATLLAIHIEDLDTGLQDISIHIEQNLETFPLAKEQFSSHGPLSIDGGEQHTYDIELIPFADDTLPKRRGRAKLVIQASDYSWRNFFGGNTTRFEQEFSVKFTPPRLEVLSSHDPIPQGGSGLVFYRVSEDAQSHGVQIGEAFFPGYPTPDESREFSLIAVPHDLSPKQPIQLIAEDGLGNNAILNLDYKIRKKSWRTRRIKITDRFIQQTVMPIIHHTPELQDQGENLKNFILVNNSLRKQNNQQLQELSQKTQSEFLWKGAFLQLSKSQVEAAFADHRRYIYKGRSVDTQDHLGFDLAVTKQYPVEATNSGEVIFANYLGIYGNSIVIDHGHGLQSLYAHLSSFDVKEGDWVEKGQSIARTGTTGLAAGDHLHFSLLLHGVQVNPTEWWDPQWVKTRISDRLHLRFQDEPTIGIDEVIGPPPPTREIPFFEIN